MLAKLSYRAVLRQESFARQRNFQSTPSKYRVKIVQNLAGGLFIMKSSRFAKQKAREWEISAVDFAFLLSYDSQLVNSSLQVGARNF
jgi:hypothetical protein